MPARRRRARVEDVHELAIGMPHVEVVRGARGNPIYQVGGKSFVFFRTPRPDAVDPDTGERYPDVIVFWVPSESDKLALVQDPASPFFTTPHFDGHPSVLLRASRVGELTMQELTEVVQDAWLAQASPRRAATWLDAQRSLPSWMLRRDAAERTHAGTPDLRLFGRTLTSGTCDRFVGTLRYCQHVGGDSQAAGGQDCRGHAVAARGAFLRSEARR